MPVYIYETLEEDPQENPRRFELKQSMNDPALTHDPETGKPVKRVISGGYGVLQKGGGASSAPSSGSCGHGCGCH